MRDTAKSYALTGAADPPTNMEDETFDVGAWYAAPIPRKRMKQLMKRSNGPAIRHFALWGALLVLSGIGLVLTWGSWWAVAFAMPYGVLYSMSDLHAHELSHGTPFKTRSINDVLYQINGFMTLHEADYWSWSHTRHHTDTLQVGRDPEIAVMAPPHILKGVRDFVFLWTGIALMRQIFRHAAGDLSGDGEHFIPDSEKPKVIRTARIYTALILGTVAACLVFGSWLPLALVVGPRFYGAFMAQLFNITQHAGLRENYPAHRQNCRTFYANPVFRFLYMNMKYHVEHPMFPMVPFHRLPELHEEMKPVSPPAYPSVWACWAELVPAVWKQRKTPDYYGARPVPETA
jgi:fatty acid desaturase